MNRQCILPITITLLLMIGLSAYSDITPVSDRTPEVRDAIVAAISDVDNAAEVTEAHLAAITTLDLRNKGITELQSGDFSGLTGLTNLNLYNNELSSLPDGIFEGLAALTTLRLGSNTVNPMPITVAIEKVGTDQIKAVAPTGAPFRIVVPISATNGSIADSATSLTIAKGRAESSTVTVTRTANSTEAVTADIGTLPSLPINHYGYVLSKSANLLLEVISDISTTEEEQTTPTPPVVEETETPVQNAAPTFSDGSSAVRSIAENTASDMNIGTPVAATDANEDTLTYTLDGIDAASFAVDSTTGQLKTKAILDYETKRIYTLTITASDGSLTGTISVIISVIDVAETTIVSNTLSLNDRTPVVRNAIVAAIPDVDDPNDVTETHLATITSLSLLNANITELKTGDFSGLSAVSNLNLYGNMLSSLPNGIFQGLTGLSTLRLGGNAVDPMPLTVALQQDSNGEFKAVVPVGAPFDIMLQINGSTITIPKGSIASETFMSADIPNIDGLPTRPKTHFGYILTKSDVCNRTQQVSDTITEVVPHITDCRNVSDVHLAAITSLDLSGMSIDSLMSGDFARLYTLHTLNLSNNQLTSLPDSIFSGLKTLDELNLSVNAVDPLPLSVRVQKVGNNSIKVVVPTGAPFDMRLPITVVNGSTIGSSMLIVQKGMTESDTLLVTRNDNTLSAVTVDLGTLPNLPSLHTGYSLTKSNTEPLEIFSENNVAPVFTDGTSTTRTIAENSVANRNIGAAITATDANNDTLRYTLSGTDADSFSIVSTTGQLQTKSDLDYETKTTYSVNITVSDGSLTDAIAVTINVTDVSENHAPVFTEGDSATRSISENTDAGTNIGSPIIATDADDDRLNYTLSGTDAVDFEIDRGTGQLKAKSDLDYETKTTYSVTVNVSDGSLTDIISVTINITNIDETPPKPVIDDDIVITPDDDDIVITPDDDTPPIQNTLPNNAPVFTDGASTTRSVEENTGSGVDIGSAISATDEDNDTLTYSLDGTDASSFSIDSSSGQLRTSAPLDYEDKTSYSVTVSVTDGEGGSDSISVTINITNVDESPTNNAPVFTDGSSTTRSVEENTSSGVEIGSAVSATDVDDDTLTYTLSGTDASSFSIDSSSGQLQTSTQLNYEEKTSYSVTVSVTDGNGGNDSIAVTINVTDVNEAPEFSDGDTTNRSIAENTTANTNIGSAVSATDVDGDTLTYTLSGTNATDFNIESSTGQLKTKSPLDYELNTSYSVTITVSDGNLEDTIVVTINVTNLDETPSNNAPVFSDGNSTTRSVDENTPSGTNIGSAVSATDADNNTLTYTFSGDDASSFSIVSTTGQLKTNAALNHEENASYSVTVTVNDGTLQDTITVTINVNDVNDAPVYASSSATRSIDENTAIGTNIGAAFTATDEDNDTLAYALSGPNASSFDIDSTTGQLKTKTALDYETKTSYSVTITVTDDDEDNPLSDSISVTVTINNLDENRAPVFTEGTSTTRSIVENTGSGVNIGSAVSATDIDNDTLEYSLGGTDASSFRIDSTSGQLRTRTALNYEDDSSYSVTITVDDNNGGEDTINVTINVTDRNDPPVFVSNSVTRSVVENTAADTNIGSPITATDEDNDTLEYSLGGDDASEFDIVSTTGQLKTKAALDYETKASYSVIVTAKDGDNADDTINVTINVTNVDEVPIVVNNAPTFTEGNSTTRSVDENTGSGVNIGSAVSATDADNDTLEYSLGGADASSFRIDSTSGQLRTRTALNYEDDSSYSVTITVDDNNGGEDTINVTINVTDRNDPPVFASNSVTRSVVENTAADTNIGSPITATDEDNDTLEYSLGGDDASEFDIVSTTGQLKTKAALDYETKASYSVIVTAKDGDNADDTINVTINVTNVDEVPIVVNNAPTFTEGNSTTRSVDENTNSGVNIGSPIAATDDDNNNLTYTLHGTDASIFSIVRTSGQLKTNTALNYEMKDTYSVTITVNDGNGGEDTISVTINVNDVSEPPVFTDSFPASRSIAENTGAGENVGAPIAATDDDGDSIRYRHAGLDQDSFDIVRSTGQLKTKAPLDHETKDTYRVLVWADTNDKSTPMNVIISITDVNEAPVFDDGDSITLSVDENTATNTNLGAPVTATDEDDDDTLTYTLSGTDAASFGIDSTTGQLKTSAALNHETKDSYSVTITVTDGDTDDPLSDSITVNIQVRDVLENNLLTNRTEKIAREIINVTGQTHETDITAEHLAAIEELYLDSKQISSLKNGDFSGLTGLVNLYLGHNEITSFPEDVFDGLSNLTVLFIDNNPFTSLPENIFDGLSSLEKLWIESSEITSFPAGLFDGLSSLTYLVAGRSLHTGLPDGIFEGLTSLMVVQVHSNLTDSEGQFIDWFDLTVELELVESGKIKASIRTGAPFSIEVPLTVTNGSLGDGATSITIPTGSIESSELTVTRTAGTTAAVTVGMGDLPDIPGHGPHTGYNLVKPTNLPLTVIDAGAAPAYQKPNSTALFPNFPNPFNPETWIPYQLAKPADVSLTISDIRGVVVRTLTLGHVPTGVYTTRSRAIHWDGRNVFGEKVAGGMYFYVLKAGDYSATRKMLIVK